jgi:hypothetical protein
MYHKGIPWVLCQAHIQYFKKFQGFLVLPYIDNLNMAEYSGIPCGTLYRHGRVLVMGIGKNFIIDDRAIVINLLSIIIGSLQSLSI